MYNRIDNDLKLISVNHDYKRNIKVCKKLKDKHNLTYGKGKERVKREKLNDPDKVKYKIYDAIKSVLPNCKTPADLRFSLQKFGIELEYKHKRTTNNIEGVSFRYENIAFKGSHIDRKFSYGNLKKEFQKNIELLQEQVKQYPPKEQQQTESKPKTPTIGGVQLTPEQWQTLKDGNYIYLENMNRSDGEGTFSSYVFLNDEKTKVFFSRQNPDEFVKNGKYEMRTRDKILIEADCVTKAKVKWWGMGNYAYPYLWKEKSTDTEYKESWGDPRVKKQEKQKNSQRQIPQNPRKNRGRGM